MNSPSFPKILHTFVPAIFQIFLLFNPLIALADHPNPAHPFPKTSRFVQDRGLQDGLRVFLSFSQGHRLNSDVTFSSTNATYTHDRLAQPHSAAFFNIAGGEIEFSPTEAFDLHQEFSISLWVSPTHLKDSDQFLIARYKPDGWALLIEPCWRSSRFQWSIFGKMDFYSKSPAQANGSWTHVLLSRSIDGTGRFYINGELDSSASITHAKGEHIPLSLGKRSGLPTGYFSGGLDDIRIYDRALSPSEVKTLYDFDLKHSLSFSSISKGSGFKQKLLNYKRERGF